MHPTRVDVLHLAAASLDESAALGALIVRVAAMLEGVRAANRRPRVWLVTRGAFAPCADHEMAAAVWAFGRVAINEYPDDRSSAGRSVVRSRRGRGGGEARRSARQRPGPKPRSCSTGKASRSSAPRRACPRSASRAAADAAARLHFAPPELAERLEWRPVERAAPAAGEVEIAVAATGLNFRDVMYASGMLPDDILAGGFAGSTLGFECAGHVTRVGAKVSGLKPGDPVASFARDAFASHVTVPADIVLAGAAVDAAGGRGQHSGGVPDGVVWADPSCEAQAQRMGADPRRRGRRRASPHCRSRAGAAPGSWRPPAPTRSARWCVCWAPKWCSTRARSHSPTKFASRSAASMWC